MNFTEDADLFGGTLLRSDVTSGTIKGTLNEKMIAATDLKGTWKQDDNEETREYPNKYYSVSTPFYWVGDWLYGDVGDSNILFLHSISENKKIVKYSTSNTWRKID